KKKIVFSVKSLICMHVKKRKHRLAFSAKHPCLNGGSCVDNVGGFACECRPGFQGGRCETEIDECASQPCWNGANCRDYVNSFVCECRAGFDGFLCEHNIQEFETFIQLFTHLFTVLFLELCQLVQPRALSQRGLLLADRNLLDLSFDELWTHFLSFKIDSVDQALNFRVESVFYTKCHLKNYRIFRTINRT
uniref:EGF-like domain-containing protein n=1 Tax=Hippocampus comes TaxID=109280 RepID=A0A3Q2Z0A5_HIPCM